MSLPLPVVGIDKWFGADELLAMFIWPNSEERSYAELVRIIVGIPLDRNAGLGGAMP